MRSARARGAAKRSRAGLSRWTNGCAVCYRESSMARSPAIRTRPGRRSGEWVVTVPPGWELRLRRVVRELLLEGLPDPHEKGLTPYQRQARVETRRRRVREAMCQFVSDLITADIVSREVALTTRTHFGSRRGSLREQVHAVLREALEGMPPLQTKRSGA